MPILDETALNIFTDGSSYSNPRKGGIGVRFVTVNEDGNEEFSNSFVRGFSGATNNEMELQACIHALESCLSKHHAPVNISKYSRVVIYTDSRYVVENMPRAIFSWSKNKWRNHNGSPVGNAELWSKLVKLTNKLYRECGIRVSFEWVKAHKNSAHNKVADRLAKSSAKNATKDRISVTKVRRKKSKRITVLGSVKLKNQLLTIRIIQDKYYKKSKCYWYRYEVMSRNSEYYGNIDIATSSYLMNAGHTYFVRMNDDIKNPQIIRVFKEIKP